MPLTPPSTSSSASSVSVDSFVESDLTTLQSYYQTVAIDAVLRSREDVLQVLLDPGIYIERLLKTTRIAEKRKVS